MTTGWTGILLGLMVWTSMAGAQTIYKSVDTEGNVTYSSEAPADDEVVDSATIPPVPATDDSASGPASRTLADQLEADRLEREQARDSEQSARKQQAEAAAEPPALTREQLEQRCEQARQARIAPLRQAEIDRCKAEGRKDPDHCERYYADYGDAFRSLGGDMVPRMFSDLPECLEAEQARRSGR